MKKFLFALLLLASFVASSQPTGYSRLFGRYKYIAGIFDSTLHIPTKATNGFGGGWTGKGATMFNTTDSSVYINSGYQWLKIGREIDEKCGLLQPGYVTWDSLLIFNISPSIYRLCCDSIARVSVLTSVTLTAADPTLNRFDAIVLTTSGVVVRQGTSAATAALPQPQDCEILLTHIYIPAGSLTPGTTPDGGTPSQTVIYDETGGTEWTGAATGVTVNFSNTTNPYKSTIAADVGTYSAGQDFSFTKGSGTVDLTNYTSLKFYIRLKSALSPQAKIGIWFYNTGNALGSKSIILENGKYNFVRTSTGVYQEINIPMSEFIGGTTSTVNRLWFLFLNTGNADGFYIDWIHLQGGISQPSTTQANSFGVVYTQSGISLATQPTDILTINGAGGITTSASGKTVTITQGSPSVPINTLLAATGTNTINNGNHAQEWQWNTLAGVSALKLSSTSTAAASNLQKLFNVQLDGVNSNSSQRTWGIYARNSHTGTGSINVAIYGIAANGASGNIGVEGVSNGSGLYGIGVSGANSAAGTGIEAANTGESGTGYAFKAISDRSGGDVGIAGYFSATNATNNYAIIVPTASGNVGIGTSTPSSQALLELSSTTQALLLMRMTATQASAITPADGMIVYVTDTNGTFTSAGFWGYQAGAWGKF